MATFGPQNWTTKTGKSIVFRHCEVGGPGKPGDVDAFLDFQPQAARETNHTLQVPGRVPERSKVEAAWAESIQEPEGLRVGAFVGDRMIAQLGFHLDNPARHPWVKHIGRFGMMILQDYWGEGIGRRLLEIMEAHARPLGIKRLEALVRVKNARGLKLYSRMGYRIEGTRRQAALIDGVYQDEYFISKLLDEEGANWRPPVIETENLILRPLSLQDAPSIFEYAGNPNVSRHTLWEPHQSVKDSEAYILDYVLPYYRDQVPEPWGIALKSKPAKVVGTVGLFWASKPAKSMELAYAISEEHWGKGFVAEASRVAIRYVFANLEVNRVQAHCKAENQASARVMLKIGMKPEGCMRSAFFHRGRHWDMIFYSVLRQEWPVTFKKAQC